MVWKIEFDEAAKNALAKLDKPVQKRIIKFLEKRIQPISDPRSIGDPLHGNLRGFWRYRVGDYRLICEIEDHKILIVVINIGHRKQVYRAT